jgi:L-serine dehydratase
VKSLTKIFRTGNGPSSSHTMGPERAARIFKKRYPEAAGFRAVLYGSLAATGKGHLTDIAIKKVFGDKLNLFWEPEKKLPHHPNGMKFYALDKKGIEVSKAVFYSTGGGAISESGEKDTGREIYHLNSLEKIILFCRKEKLSFHEYVFLHEDKSILPYLIYIWKTMQNSIEAGLEKDGILPGTLKLKRRAKSVMKHSKSNRTAIFFSGTGHLTGYALAVAEENAGGGKIVTAPTCGACGVVPAVLKYLQKMMGYKDREIMNALATAGLIGNLVKQNASISGAEAGCQAEIGTACAMAAAAATQILGGDLNQIEYAAEMGIEHHLGLTCDPVYGLVQIPCIERNAFAANRALNCAHYALATDGIHHIPFDDVVHVMIETGNNMSALYKETSKGGLAEKVRANHSKI